MPENQFHETQIPGKVESIVKKMIKDNDYVMLFGVNLDTENVSMQTIAKNGLNREWLTVIKENLLDHIHNQESCLNQDLAKRLKQKGLYTSK